MKKGSSVRARMIARMGFVWLSLAPSGAFSQSSPSDFTTGYRFDASGRQTGIISPDPDGSGPLRYAAVRKTYDPDGNLTKLEMGELTSWQSEEVSPATWTGFTVFTVTDTAYDEAGRKIKETRFASDTIFGIFQYSYDAAGRLQCTAVRMNPAAYGSLPSSACSLGDAGAFGPDRITKNEYDAAGQLKQVRKAVGTPLEQAYATYDYTPNGKQGHVIDAGGNRAKLEYDGFDRLVKWTFPSSTKPSAFNPASAASALSTAGTLNVSDYEQYGYDASGNRTSFRRRNGNPIGYTYDGLNRMTSKSSPANGTVPAESVWYGYDNRGLQLYARYGSSSGEGVTSDYDGLGRLTSSTINMGGVSQSLGYLYDANGNRRRITHPDGTFFTYNYDGLDRVKEIKENDATLIASISYNARGEREALGRGSGAATTGYSYDPVGRLAGLSQDLAGTSADATYSYGWTPASQLTTIGQSNNAYGWTGEQNLSRSYTVNGLNQYQAAGPAAFTYDGNGNLTSDASQGGTVNFTYDNENRLRSASGAKTAALAYDPLGRLWQTSGGSGGTTRFLYDGDALVAEYNGSNQLLRRYVHGPGVDEPLVWYEGAALADRRTLQADHQGTIITVANSAGSSLRINSYDAWGIPADNNLGRFRYTGQINLPELGFYHYKARIYSPTLGRFLQTDPVGYEDQVNLYAYVGNDPVNNVDPSGMCPSCIVGAAVEVGFQLYTGELQGAYSAAASGDVGPALISLGKIGVSAASGGISGQAASAAVKVVGKAYEAASMGKAATVAAKVQTMAASQAATGAVTKIATNAVEGKPLSKDVGTAAAVSATVGTAGSIGGNRIAASVGGTIGANAGTVAKISGQVITGAAKKESTCSVAANKQC